MSDQVALDGNPEDHKLDLDAPAETSPNSQLMAKPGALTGALVQRGRERAPRLMETSLPMEPVQSVAPPFGASPVYEAVPALDATLATPQHSRWTDAIFAAACCVAFFATFLFVLRF
jgi:hypothetical protein